MRISSKGRYGLAIMANIAQNNNDFVSISNIAKDLDISKVYLEQIITILKKNNLLKSLKGPRGGYKLGKNIKDISVYEILSALEQTLFEPAEKNYLKNSPSYELAFEQLIFNPLDSTVKETLESISLEEVINSIEENSGNFMYYI